MANRPTYPCSRCPMGEKFCINHSRWQRCEDYRKWLNWSWARYRGKFRRYDEAQARRAAVAKDVWRYQAPYEREGEKCN